jgi:hypothetical protein
MASSKILAAAKIVYLPQEIYVDTDFRCLNFGFIG